MQKLTVSKVFVLKIFDSVLTVNISGSYISLDGYRWVAFVTKSYGTS
jgi:hypothetical protein